MPSACSTTRDERIRRAQSPGGGFHFRFADGRVFVEQLALEIVRGDFVEVRDPERADARGRRDKAPRDCRVRRRR